MMSQTILSSIELNRMITTQTQNDVNRLINLEICRVLGNNKHKITPAFTSALRKPKKPELSGKTTGRLPRPPSLNKQTSSPNQNTKEEPHTSASPPSSPRLSGPSKRINSDQKNNNNDSKSSSSEASASTSLILTTSLGSATNNNQETLEDASKIIIESEDAEKKEQKKGAKAVGERLLEDDPVYENDLIDMMRKLEAEAKMREDDKSLSATKTTQPNNTLGNGTSTTGPSAWINVKQSKIKLLDAPPSSLLMKGKTPETHINKKELLRSREKRKEQHKIDMPEGYRFPTDAPLAKLYGVDMNDKVKAHQREAIKWMIDAESNDKAVPGVLLGSEQGTGKTRMGWGFLLHGKKPGPSLIVCDKGNVQTWIDELEQELLDDIPDEGIRLFVPSMDGEYLIRPRKKKAITTAATNKKNHQTTPSSPQQKTKTPGSPFHSSKYPAPSKLKKRSYQDYGSTGNLRAADWWKRFRPDVHKIAIVNYEHLTAIRASSGARAVGPFAVRWRAVVLDECQRIKGGNTVTDTVCELDRGFSAGLSGTLFNNDVSEYYYYLKFIGHSSAELDLKMWKRRLGEASLFVLNLEDELNGKIKRRYTMAELQESDPTIRVPEEKRYSYRLPFTNELELKLYCDVTDATIAKMLSSNSILSSSQSSSFLPPSASSSSSSSSSTSFQEDMERRIGKRNGQFAMMQYRRTITAQRSSSSSSSSTHPSASKYPPLALTTTGAITKTAFSTLNKNEKGGNDFKLQEVSNGVYTYTTPSRDAKLTTDREEVDLHGYPKNRFNITYPRIKNKIDSTNGSGNLPHIQWLRSLCISPLLITTGLKTDEDDIMLPSGGGSKKKKPSNTKTTKTQKTSDDYLLDDNDDDDDSNDDFLSNDRSNEFEYHGINNWIKIPKSPTPVEEMLSYKSTKMNQVINLLRNVMKPGEKMIIFCEFLKALDVTELAIKKAQRNGELPEHLQKTKVTRLDGSMKLPERIENLKRFRHTSEYNIILITTGAGGKGLNIPETNYITFLSPWWNPQKDEQAIYRGKRLNSIHGILVFWLLIKGSIEEEIFDLARKKLISARDVDDRNSFTERSLKKKKLEKVFTPVKLLQILRSRKEWMTKNGISDNMIKQLAELHLTEEQKFQEDDEGGGVFSKKRKNELVLVNNNALARRKTESKPNNASVDFVADDLDLMADDDGAGATITTSTSSTMINDNSKASSDTSTVNSSGNGGGDIVSNKLSVSSSGSSNLSISRTPIAKSLPSSGTIIPAPTSRMPLRQPSTDAHRATVSTQHTVPKLHKETVMEMAKRHPPPLRRYSKTIALIIDTVPLRLNRVIETIKNNKSYSETKMLSMRPKDSWILFRYDIKALNGVWMKCSSYDHRTDDTLPLVITTVQVMESLCSVSDEMKRFFGFAGTQKEMMDFLKALSAKDAEESALTLYKKPTTTAANKGNGSERVSIRTVFLGNQGMDLFYPTDVPTLLGKGVFDAYFRCETYTLRVSCQVSKTNGKVATEYYDLVVSPPNIRRRMELFPVS